ncbi:MAG: anthranilate synthase component I [Bifidobacteriaceae bacterium]|jgi:anthranilate synthase component 1|nr:anthranilate synthase component I [Bifidobacteriaceae bacterium]
MTATPSPTPGHLPLGETWPDRADFHALALEGRRVIPVVRRFLADGETPVGIYRKLARGRPGTFLLESAEHGGLYSRYSIIGASAQATLSADDAGEAAWIGRPPDGVPTQGPALEVLAATLEILHTPPIDGLPPLTGGLVGAIAYDAVRHLERIVSRGVEELGLPILSLALATDLAILDHSNATVWLIANAINQDGTSRRESEAWASAVARLDTMTEALAAPAASTVAVFSDVDIPDAPSRTDKHDFLASVETAKHAIVDGEAFQIVLAQRFDVATDADPLDIYRVLRASNPSPYMYLLTCQNPRTGTPFVIVGSSPEALVTATGGHIVSHPIAGTRPRGTTPEHDKALATELLADPKERAEHIMLVDLARNDVARVSETGTIEVVEFMAIERYSHVMHIVSTVTGRQRPDATAVDVLTATFPAGTLSGAPKPRAMQIIEDLEPVHRGIYAGVVGYLDFAGNLDMAITIRTAILTGGIAHVAAGAGIVADSTPLSEYHETRAKAAATLAAITAATTMTPLTPGPHTHPAGEEPSPSPVLRPETRRSPGTPRN